MIPTVTSSSDDFIEDFEIINKVNEPTYTYKLDYDNNRVIGYTDNQDAIKQLIFKLLNTEKNDFIIYNYTFGAELKDLIGQHVAYVIPEVERRIKEALLSDERIINVFDFEFDTSVKSKLLVTFKVNSIYGTVESETNFNY